MPSRLPMPRPAPFALAEEKPPRSLWRKATLLLVFFFLFGIPFFAAHYVLLPLPYFWDEHGQFIPTALDLWRDGAWVAHSTLPNVHPPGVAVYLAAWFQIFGYSITIVRVAMLVLACLGLSGIFLLAVELSSAAEGAPAFLPPLLMMVSPLFFMQAMMAQLDMPAMVFTVWALLFFLRGNHPAAGAISVALVLAKETGVVAPIIFFILLLREQKKTAALAYLAAPVALACWLLVLHHATGNWMGNAGFAHYNIAYSLQPVRLIFTFLRRIYYLFFAELRWIATAALVFAVPRLALFRSRAWLVTGLVAGGNLLLMTLAGGAALERYLLPVLPLFYIAASIAFTALPKRLNIVATALLFLGLFTSLFWNPPYPFPFENNLAMVDFVGLQKAAAEYAESNLPLSRIATAWPYTAGLARPDYGFVHHGLSVVETNDFHRSSIAAIPPDQFDVLITYTRTWAPERGVVSIPLVRDFLTRYYDFAPEISDDDCAQLGLVPLVSWARHGQKITIYQRASAPEIRSAKLMSARVF
jgi:hypothetical protein